MKKTLVSLALAGFALSTTSAMAAEQPSFNFVSADFVEYDLDGTDFDGFSINANYALGNNLFMEADLQRLSRYDINNLIGTVGFGYAHFVHETTAITGSVGTGYDRVTGLGLLNDSGHFSYANVGVRSRLHQMVELGADVQRNFAGSGLNETSYGVEARFFVQPQFSIDVGYRYVDSDLDGYRVGVAYHF
ncbi:hypothetical protein [Aliidiomarina maris]|uniref:Opacity protein-like surface antigen n=1 Tax=Aliidiomarina maris TaxID=531312 RepID=A0A327X6D3_9GAMM|nr:hypothetical protein [Aliidiomarina maris]RAK00673.1 hypothetical protein B0I24_10298 [Aliidiomarina maris]RUO27320.1 hypothetical protein CWE07_05085 [Aliidiomarina maris]